MSLTAATAFFGVRGCAASSFITGASRATSLRHFNFVTATAQAIALPTALDQPPVPPQSFLRQRRQDRSSPNLGITLRKLSSSSTTSDDPVAQVICQESFDEMKLVKEYCHQVPPPKSTPLLLETASEVSSYIFENFDTILFDCDGVLYRGSHVLPGTSQALRRLIVDQQKQVFFVTNNAATNRSQLRDKLQSLLQLNHVLTVEQMIPSSYSAARFLALQFSSCLESRRQKTVHVIGTEGLRQEMRDAGFHVTFVSNDEEAAMTRDDLAAYDFDAVLTTEPTMDALVVGLDTSFTYRKLCVANVLLQRFPEALLIATNQDAYDLVGVDARHLPGNGSIVAALQWASPSHSAFYNVGKPSSILAQWMQKDFGFSPARTLMIGDRLDTDVYFGQVSGIASALVLSGVTTAELLKAQLERQEEPVANSPDSTPPIVPDIVFPHVGLLGQN